MRIIIQCPERILHLEAEYIYADCLSPTSNLLQSGGGPYIFDDNLNRRPLRIWLVNAAKRLTQPGA